MALTEEQMLMLNNLIYLKHFSSKVNRGKKIGEILEELTDKDLSDTYPPTPEEWKQIIENAKSDTTLCDLYVYTNKDNKESGGREMCVTTQMPEENDIFPEDTEAYVIFAGTGANEWRDNAVAATEVDSEYQREALKFVEDLPESLENITVSGHSKGGNKAMYVMIRSDRVKECYSYDGEGFSQEFINEYEDEIEKKRIHIHARSHYRDYVNLLLKPIAGDMKYYTNERGIDKDSKMSIGEYHRPDLMFKRDKDGNILYEMSEAGEQEWTMKFLHEFVIYLMEHVPKGEQIVAMSVLGELLQMLAGNKKSVVNEEIIERFGMDAVEILLKYFLSFIMEYRKKNPVQYQLNIMSIYNIMLKFFGVKSMMFAPLIYALLNSDNIFVLAVLFGYIYNSMGGGSIIRDFSENTKERLLSMAQEVEDEPWWNLTKWDCWYRLEKKVGLLNIDYYADNINAYYRKLIDINDASRKDIEKIFEKVYEIDSRYGMKIRNHSQNLSGIADKISRLASSVSVR